MAPLPYPEEHDFPLAGETVEPDHGGLTGEDAAAAGNSSGGVSLSHGGLIAIIVVVVIVAIMGSESCTIRLKHTVIHCKITPTSHHPRPGRTVQN